MGIFALFGHGGAGRAHHHGAVHALIRAIVDLRAVRGDDDPVALLQIAQLAGIGRQRESVRAEEHLALAIAEHERRALARADHHPVMALENGRNGKGAFQLGQYGLHGRFRVRALFHLAVQQMGDHLAVGLGREFVAVFGKLGAVILEILDDAIVDNRHRAGAVRVGIALGRRAMGRPAGVGNAEMAVDGIGFQRRAQIGDLAGGAAALQPVLADHREAGAVITAIFQPCQATHQALGDFLVSGDPDNTAHRLTLLD